MLEEGFGSTSLTPWWKVEVLSSLCTLPRELKELSLRKRYFFMTIFKTRKAEFASGCSAAETADVASVRTSTFARSQLQPFLFLHLNCFQFSSFSDVHPSLFTTTVLSSSLWSNVLRQAGKYFFCLLTADGQSDRGRPQEMLLEGVHHSFRRPNLSPSEAQVEVALFAASNNFMRR